MPRRTKKKVAEISKVITKNDYDKLLNYFIKLTLTLKDSNTILFETKYGKVRHLLAFLPDFIEASLQIFFLKEVFWDKSKMKYSLSTYFMRRPLEIQKSLLLGEDGDGIYEWMADVLPPLVVKDFNNRYWIRRLVKFPFPSRKRYIFVGLTLPSTFYTFEIRIPRRSDVENWMVLVDWAIMNKLYPPPPDVTEIAVGMLRWIAENILKDEIDPSFVAEDIATSRLLTYYAGNPIDCYSYQGYMGSKNRLLKNSVPIHFLCRYETSKLPKLDKVAWVGDIRDRLRAKAKSKRRKRVSS